jgi:uncharacterized protein
VIHILRIPVLILGLISITLSASLTQEISAEKRAELEKLMNLIGALKVTQVVSQELTGQLSKELKTSYPAVPQSRLDAMTEEFGAVISENLPSLIETSVHIYDKHFTIEEVRSLIDFYSSNIGKKVIQVMPTVAEESMRAGRDWGESLKPELQCRIQARLKNENTLPKN